MQCTGVIKDGNVVGYIPESCLQFVLIFASRWEYSMSSEQRKAILARSPSRTTQLLPFEKIITVTIFFWWLLWSQDHMTIQNNLLF